MYKQGKIANESTVLILKDFLRVYRNRLSNSEKDGIRNAIRCVEIVDKLESGYLKISKAEGQRRIMEHAKQLGVKIGVEK